MFRTLVLAKRARRGRKAAYMEFLASILQPRPKGPVEEAQVQQRANASSTIAEAIRRDELRRERRP